VEFNPGPDDLMRSTATCIGWSNRGV
jgi:hypothetical protein